MALSLKFGKLGLKILIVKIFGIIRLEIIDEANAMKQINEKTYPNILKNGDDVNKNYGCLVIILMCNIF